MLRSRFLLTAMVAVVAALAAPATSQAAFTLALTQTAGGPTPAAQGAVFTQNAFTGGNGTTLLVTDQALTPAQFPTTPGTIFDGSGSTLHSGNIDLAQINSNGTLNGNVTFGAFVLSLSGFSDIFANMATVSGTSATTTTVSNISTTSATIRIVLTEDAFTGPSGPAILRMTNTLTILSFNPNGSTLSNITSGSEAFNDPASVSQSLDNAAIIAAANASGTQPLAASTLFNRNGAATFTGIHYVELTLAAGASIQFQARTEIVNAVPAPTGLVMLAGALPFAGLFRLRRRGQTVAPATAA